MDYHSIIIRHTCARIILTLIIMLSSTCWSTLSYADNGVKRRLPCDNPQFGFLHEGMASPFCRAIVQDRKGFLWIGTDNGVVRYDGLHTHCFGNVETSPKVRGQMITALIEDTISNCIWAGIDQSSALMRIDTKTFDISTLKYDIDGNVPLPFKTTFSIMSANDSTLICRLARGYYAINKNTGSSKLLKPYKGFMNSVRTTFINFGGSIYNVGGGAVYRITPLETKDIATIEKVGIRNLTNIKDIAIKDDSTLIILTMARQKEYGIYLFKAKANSVEYLGTCEASPHGMASADDGLWIATNHGLAFLNYDDKTLRYFTSANSNIQDNDISCIAKAYGQHVFFIGTSDGLATLSYFNSKFQRTDMRRYSASTNPQVWSSAKDSHKGYWIGCLDGLYKLRQNSVYYNKIKLGKSEEKEMIISINETTRQDGIIVSTPKDIYRLDYEGRIVKHLLHDNDLIRSTQPIAGGQVIVTRRQCISIISDKDGHTIKSINPTESASFVSARTDDGKTLWVVDSKQELDGYDIATLDKKYIILLQKDSIGAIRDVRHNVSQGIDELWIATTDGGLLYKNPGFSGTTTINGSQLLQTSVHAMELDAQGTLWVATSLGLVNIHDGKITDYSTEEYGLCSNFINHTPSRGANGEMLFGGKNDFIEFTPSRFTDNDYFPTPQITSYQYHNVLSSNTIEQERILYGGGDITIPPGTGGVMVNIRTLNYDNSNRINTEWSLDGDDNWESIQPDGDLLLTGLSEGNHTVRFRSVDDNGVPQKGICTLKISKNVFIYETKLFTISIITSIAAIIAMLWIWNNSQYRKIRNKLKNEVSAMSSMLTTANAELRKRQVEIQKRNDEISAMNNNLQELVEQRTKELKDAKVKAEESSQLKSDFLASLGHEIRTPMNAIVGFARLLQSDDCNDKERIEFAGLIAKSSNSLLSLFSSLLDTSRIERGVLEVNFVDVDIYQEINDAYKILSVENKNDQVDFLLDLSENLRDCIVQTDKERLRQIIINITYNAFKFTHKGHVRITAKLCGAAELTQYGLKEQPQDLDSDAQTVLIAIEDTGVGIPADKTEIIFEPFRRLSGNTVKHPGLGLGLNIAKNLVGLLGGAIWLRSAVGLGSTFTFYLPVKHINRGNK